MTQRDIRDIAAYWGAPVQLIVDGRINEGKACVDWTLLKHITFLDKVNLQFKLMLRPIASLTDEELTECAKIDAGGDFRYGGVTSIDRYGDKLHVVYGNGASVSISTDYFYEDGFTYSPIEIATYLQSIGVHVSGTIDEKYVHLI